MSNAAKPPPIVFAWSGDRKEPDPPSQCLTWATVVVACITLIAAAGAGAALSWALLGEEERSVQQCEDEMPSLSFGECDPVAMAVSRTDQAVLHWYQGSAELGAAPVTLLVFFETWCVNCQAHASQIARLDAGLAEDGLQVIGLTLQTDSSPEQVDRFVAQHKWRFPVGRDAGPLSAAFGVVAVPTAVLLRGEDAVWMGHPQDLSIEEIQGILQAQTAIP